MGNTKNSDGGYFRQLVFYRLLLDIYDDGKYKMKGGEIDFVEADKNGKYHKEYIEIEEEDVENLKVEIERTAQEILDLSFWDKKCDDKKCEYCHLRDQISEPG